MPLKQVSNAAETPVESHDGHFAFCPATPDVRRRFVRRPVQRIGDCSQAALGRSAMTG
jgi:hypothetical protein